MPEFGPVRNWALRVSLLILLASVALPQAPGSGASRKFRVSDPAAASRLVSGGGKLLVDYGAFQLIEVPTSSMNLAAMATADGAEARDDYDQILLNTGPIDTTVKPVRAAQQALDGSAGKRLHLVHFVGPVKPEWVAALRQTGVEIVTYLPTNAYLIYGDTTALRAAAAPAAGSLLASFMDWEDVYLDSYKIDPNAKTKDAAGRLRAIGTNYFAVQLVADKTANPATVNFIKGIATGPLIRDERKLNYHDVVAPLPPDRLVEIAARADVISIQPYMMPEKFDERQNQIIAGNLAGNGPSGPGYLAWLAGKGFNQNQFNVSGFAVDVTDSGIDNGTPYPNHFGLYRGGVRPGNSRVVYNRLEGSPNGGSTIRGVDGHGNLNAHIIGGFNNLTGLPHQDASGFRYGLGVAPFVRLGGSVIFDPGNFTFPSYKDLQSRAYRDGARVSSNSWGANTGGAYNIDAQSYDALVRDAQPADAAVSALGNQEMVIVFANGNAGSGSQTVGSPATGKNVLSVGAAENVQAFGGSDGSGVGDSGADNANDIIGFSSRGPCTDGRKKPEIVAPGTHVSGGVWQTANPGPNGTADPLFDGSGVSGGILGSRFFPGDGSTQQFYSASSGTSHSTPAVAGGAALVRQYFLNRNLTAPSPAMTKGFLVNTSRYLNGVSANDVLPSNSQGMGEMNLGMAFDTAARYVRDQLAPDKFTATGQSRVFNLTVVDAAKPLRVTVAWTDAPGSTTGNAYKNDIDLTVVAGGNTYRGNVFTGANSTTGGVADPRNNVESVFLPAGVSGAVTVTVTASSINSDGVPGDAALLDQDFALVVYDALPAGTVSVVPNGTAIVTESFNPANGVIENGETVAVNFTLQNAGSTAVGNLVATLQSSGGVTAGSLPQNYGSLAVGASATAPFSFTASGTVGAVFTATFDLTDGATNLGTVAFDFRLPGAPSPAAVGATITAESIAPANGYIDPGEVVTVNFALSNNGEQSFTNLTGTLQASGGVVSPGGPQSYGPIPVGATVGRAFTFTGSGAIGSTLTATLQLQDGATNYGTVTYTFRVGRPPDYFTELFDTPNDTDNQSWLFTPDASPSFYSVVRTAAAAFPTDPAGGTSLPMSDDTFAQVTPTGAQQVKLYGTSYPTLYVGSNGYVTFTSGDSSFSESLASHFNRPRITALMDDLLPTTGQVTWRQTADRVAVTWQGVREYSASNLNSFQIEMFFDGRIRITCLGIAATDGLIGLSQGIGTPSDFQESDFSAYSAFALAVTLPVSATEGDAPQAGTVTATPAPASDLVVALASSVSSRATVPANVTILAGQTSAPFLLTVVDDSLLNGTASASVSASAGGYAPGSKQISIFDNETAILSVSLPASAAEGVGSVQGTVNVSAAPAEAVSVSLSSSDPTAALPPATVLIPAGQTSANFTLAIIDDTKINGTHAAIITAQVQNWTGGSAAIDVLDNEILSLTLSLPAQVIEGTAGTGTVAIQGTLPTNLTVNLQSNNTAQVTVPATATIIAGQTLGSFAVTAVDDTDIDGTQSATITATATGFTSDSGPVSALDNELDRFTVGAIGASQIRGIPFSVSITAKNSLDQTITNYSGSADLSAAGPGGTVSVSPGTVTGFVNGVWTGNVTANTFGTNVVLTASSAGRSGASNAFNVTFGAIHHFGWAPIGATQTVGVPFGATITAQDAANNTVNSYSGSAALSAGPAARTVGTGTIPSGQPMYTFYHDNRMQSIYLASELGAAGTISALSLNVTTVPGQTMNNWTIRMKHTALASYSTPSWDASGWTTAHQSNATVSATGWVTFVFPTPFNYDGVSNLLIDFSFNNSSYTSEGRCLATTTAATRSIYYFTDSGFGDPLTWTGTSNPTPNTSIEVPNLRLTMVRNVAMTPVTTGSFANGVWAGDVTVQQAATGVNLLADNGSGISGASNIFTVIPLAVLAVDPADGFSTSGPLGGPFSPPSKSYTISNTGLSPMSWTASSTVSGVTLSPASGTLAAGANTTVTATTNANVNALDPGTYSGTISFTNTTSGLGNTTRSAELTLTMPVPVLNPKPAITGGTTSPVSWNFLPGVDQYEVQYAPAFGSPVSSGPILGTTHAFIGLADGPTYYRVRARRFLAAAPATWTQTSQADFSTGTASNISITASPGDVVLLPAAVTWTETFDQPGSAWAATIFADGAFVRDPVSAGASIPNTTPPLPVNQDGDNEAQGDNTSVLMAAPNAFANGSIEGYIVPASASTAAYSGLLLRSVRSGVQISGYGAVIANTSSTQSLSIYRFTNGSASLLGATVPFIKIGTNENLRLRFATSGTTLTASLWKVAINAGSVVETPIILENSTNSIVRTNTTYTSGVAGLFSQVTSPINKSLFDDIAVTSASGYVSSGTITTGVIAPSPLARWGQLNFTRDISDAGTALTVDVLDAAGAVLAGNVTSGTQLNLIPSVAAQASIKLRANLSTSVPQVTPKLRDWTVSYSANSAATLDSGWSPVIFSLQDGTPPSLSALPADYTTTEQSSLALQGTSSDANGVQSVTVNSATATTGDAFAQWSTAVPALPVGFSNFTVIAQDNAVPPNVTTVLRRILRCTPTSISFGDGLPDKWKIDNGLDPFDNTGVNGANGDSEKDGIVNLLERALNLDPHGADTTGLPAVGNAIHPGDGLPYLTFTYRRLLVPTGIAYIVETSPETQTWTPLTAPDFEEISNTPTGDGVTASVILRLKPPLNTPALTAKFVRLRVTAQ